MTILVWRIVVSKTMKLSVEENDDVTTPIKLFLYGSWPFMATPYKLASQTVEVIAPAKNLSCFVLITVLTCVVYFLGIRRLPQSVDAYLFLGFLRSLCITLYSLIHITQICRNHKKVVKLINRIIQLERELPLGGKTISAACVIVLLELLGIYIFAVGVCYSLYSSRNENILIRVLVCMSGAVMCSGATTVETLCLNMLGLLTLFNHILHIRMQVLSIHTFKGVVQIKEIRNLYGKIHDTKEDVNSVYSFLLLATVSSIFQESVFFVFINILCFQGAQVDLDSMKVKLLRFWALLLLFKITAIAYVCDLLSRSGKKVGIIVHRLYARAEDQGTKTEVVFYFTAFGSDFDTIIKLDACLTHP